MPAAETDSNVYNRLTLSPIAIGHLCSKWNKQTNKNIETSKETVFLSDQQSFIHLANDNEPVDLQICWTTIVKHTKLYLYNVCQSFENR